MTVIDLAQAKVIAQEHLSRMNPRAPDSYCLIDRHTQEHDVGWVFFYSTRRYVETGDFRDGLAGNGPLLVTRDGAVHPFGTAKSPEVYLAAFRACGNAHWQPIAAVEITGWQAGAKVMSAILAIRHCSTMGLGEAKRFVEQVLDGVHVTIPTGDVEQAHALSRELHSCNFFARVAYGSRRSVE